MRNGHRLIAVVMGSSSGSVRNADVENLLLTGFDIMDRRDRGERVQLTQNMFGATHVGGAVTTMTAGGEGEGDADPIGVVLTRTTQTSGPLAVSQTMPAAKAAAHTRGNWWVQVGEFRAQRDARTQLEQVAKRFSQQFNDVEGAVDSSGRTYRARFTGFTEGAAREACGAVRSQGVPCAVGGPA
jgi:D-alanyl-D-alanine carboxypeptidase (penicillin-binding protein 5/6)